MQSRKKMVFGFLSALNFLSLVGCDQTPSTPMDAVKSDAKTDKYDVQFYMQLSKSNHAAYDDLIDYCHQNHDKPNCKNVLQAEGNLFDVR